MNNTVPSQIGYFQFTLQDWHEDGWGYFGVRLPKADWKWNTHQCLGSLQPNYKNWLFMLISIKKQQKVICWNKQKEWIYQWLLGQIKVDLSKICRVYFRDEIVNAVNSCIWNIAILVSPTFDVLVSNLQF